jgi:hypothetical protein
VGPANGIAVGIALGYSCWLWVVVVACGMADGMAGMVPGVGS